MPQPALNINELDGALGVLPSGSRPLAFVGPASSGPIDTPASFARTKDVISTYTAGPLVEAVCHWIERYQQPALVCRTGNTVAASSGTLVTTAFAGSSVPTLTSTPNDDYELYVVFLTGGTVGTLGITLQWSLDGGRTLSAVVSLGTATTYAIPGAGGTTLNFAAGTITAGSILTSRTTAPCWNSTELGTSLDALSNTSTDWELVEIVGPIDATAFDLIETKVAALSTAGKPKAWIGNCRVPTTSETEATYLTAMNTIFSAKATTYGELCYGAIKLTSSVSGRKYKRPFSHAHAAREAFYSEEIDTAYVNLGPFVGVSIRDVNGNADEHDESINPGADDARFSCARTWNEVQGVYPNRPRLFSAAGSDFQLLAHRRVMNLARRALRSYFIRRLNQPVLVDKTTGYILEAEAAEIEQGADAVLRAVLMAKPKASGGGFAQGAFVKISRTDNLLSTKTMTGQARIVPLAYVEFITLDLGFFNPALQVVGT